MEPAVSRHDTPAFGMPAPRNYSPLPNPETGTGTQIPKPHGIGPDRATLTKISGFYTANKPALHAMPVHTLDFATGQDTPRRYTQAKIIDMIFFQEGYRQAAKTRR